MKLPLWSPEWSTQPGWRGQLLYSKYMIRESMRLCSIYFKFLFFCLFFPWGKFLFILSAVYLLGDNHQRLSCEQRKLDFIENFCFTKIIFQCKSLLLLLSFLLSPRRQKQTEYTSLFGIGPPFFFYVWNEWQILWEVFVCLLRFCSQF